MPGEEGRAAARRNKLLGGEEGEEELETLRCCLRCPLPVPAPATSRGLQQGRCHCADTQV